MTGIPPRPGATGRPRVDLERSLRLIAAALVAIPIGHLPYRIDLGVQRLCLRVLHPIDRDVAVAMIRDREVT